MKYRGGSIFIYKGYSKKEDENENPNISADENYSKNTTVRQEKKTLKHNTTNGIKNLKEAFEEISSQPETKRSNNLQGQGI